MAPSSPSQMAPAGRTVEQDMSLRSMQISPVKKGRDPRLWNEEVVRALSTRLPFGRKAVTTRCSLCHSIFLPCLCPKGEDKEKCGVVPPLIVEVSEAQRLHRHGMGSLTFVKGHSFHHGMDWKHLLVVNDDHGESHKTVYNKYSILSRCGSTYVVANDESEEWQQELEMSRADMTNLVQALRNGTYANQTHHSSTEDTFEDALTFQGPEKMLQKHVTMTFGSPEEAADLKLMKVPRAVEDKQTGRRVTVDCFVVMQCGRREEACGICPGQVLVEIQCQWPGPIARKRRPQSLTPTETLLAPFLQEESVLQGLGKSASSSSGSRSGPVGIVAGGGGGPVPNLSLPRTASFPSTSRPQSGGSERGHFSPRTAGDLKQDSSLIWPCDFKFNVFPMGWTVKEVAEELNPDNWVSIRALKDLEEFLVHCRLRLTRKPIAVVKQTSSVRIRHQHLWEREVSKKRANRIHSDLEMLQQWGVSSRLTPSQLEYTFKKLINSLATELQEFEEVRLRREELIIQKCLRLVDSKHRLSTLDMNDPSRTSTHSQVEEMIRELREIFDSSPLYFVYELRDGCFFDPASDESELSLTVRAFRKHLDLSESSSPSSEPAAMSPIHHHGGEGGTIDKRQAAKAYQRLLTLIAGFSVNGPSTRALLGQPGLIRESSSSGPCHRMHDHNVDETLHCLGQIAEEYLSDVESGATANDWQEEPKSKVPGRIQVTWNAAGTAFCRDYNGRNDGRLSFNEFSRVLYDAGVSWLTKKEMEKNFQALDIDNSGYLSLGEILSVSERMLDHIKKLNALTEDLEAERRAQAGTGPMPRRLQFSELLHRYIKTEFPMLLHGNHERNTVARFADQDEPFSRSNSKDSKASPRPGPDGSKPPKSALKSQGRSTNGSLLSTDSFSLGATMLPHPGSSSAEPLGSPAPSKKSLAVSLPPA